MERVTTKEAAKLLNMYKQAEYDCKNAHDRADKQKCQTFLELFNHVLPPNYIRNHKQN